MCAPDPNDESSTPDRSYLTKDSGSRWIETTDTRWLLAGVLIVGVVIGALFAGGSPSFDGPPPDPEIESVEIVEAGCHDDVRPRSGGSTDGWWVGTINNTSTHTEVSAQIRRVSPPGATVADYRVHAETHNTTIESGECPGRIVYRVEYDAPHLDAAEVMRMEEYLNGELKSCGSSSSGPDAGCATLHESRPTHYSNGTVRDE
ncbi:hypothetical protein [Halovenus sp. HT40]|uniref:hypothetical protein n=1 Tax=Halovenus sp. HT40 TaxID=3126691 RepID=UPI00300F0DA2